MTFRITLGEHLINAASVSMFYMAINYKGRDTSVQFGLQVVL